MTFCQYSMGINNCPSVENVVMLIATIGHSHSTEALPVVVPHFHHRIGIVVLAAVLALPSKVQASNLPPELLSMLSTHTIQGNVVRPERNLEDELKLWAKVLPKLSRADAAEISRPLARRVLAAEMPRLLDAKPGELFIAWGKVLGPPLLKEIANFQNGGEPAQLNEEAVEKLRQAILKNQAARSAAAKLRIQAEAEEVKFLIENVGPGIAKAAKITASDDVRVKCAVGNDFNTVWITVSNTSDKTLTNAVIGITLDLPQGGKRAFAFFTPKFAAGESIRSQTTFRENDDFVPSLPKEAFRYDKIRLSVWSDQFVQKVQVLDPQSVQDALKAFILAGFATGMSYRTKIEYFDPKPPPYEFAVTGLQSAKGVHTISAVLTHRESKLEWTGTATVTDKDFASLNPRWRNVTMQFRTKFGLYSMSYGFSGEAMGGSGGPFNPKEGMRIFEAKSTIDAFDAEQAKFAESPEGKAFQLFRTAVSQESQGKKEEAKKLYAELIEKYPKSREAPIARRNLDRLKERKK